MRVDWAILCRFAEVDDGLATIIGGGIDTFTVPSLPALLDLVMVVRLVGSPEETEHQLAIRLVDPELKQVGKELRATFSGTPNPEALPGWEAGVILRVAAGFPAPVAGPYTLEIAVDGRAAHTVPIIVRQAAATG